MLLAVCDPATREVRQVNAHTPAYWEDKTKRAKSFSTTAERALAAGINVCKLASRRRGGCIGFAIDKLEEESDVRITLLYKRSKSTRRYSPSPDAKVYSLLEC